MEERFRAPARKSISALGAFFSVLTLHHGERKQQPFRSLLGSGARHLFILFSLWHTVFTQYNKRGQEWARGLEKERTWWRSVCSRKGGKERERERTLSRFLKIHHLHLPCHPSAPSKTNFPSPESFLLSSLLALDYPESTSASLTPRRPLVLADLEQRAIARIFSSSGSGEWEELERRQSSSSPSSRLPFLPFYMIYLAPSCYHQLRH